MSSLPQPIEPTDLAYPSLDERAERIIHVLEAAALEVGAELIAAKNDHPGRFVAWVETCLPFGLDKAERLMACTRAFATADDATRAALPPAWSALYELTRLPESRLRDAIDVGLVHPDMTVRDAKQLASGRAPEQPAPSTRETRLSCDIVARELMRYPRDELSDDVAGRLKEWLE